MLAEDLVRFLREHNMPIPPELDSRPACVLVVDDEPAITKLLARAIKSALPEVEVIEANDGFRAGGLVATLRPEVVILDLRMPGMDGFEVCKLIKSQEATRHAHVLAITAYPSQESERTILACGAKVCLAKPLDMEAMISEVRNLL